MSLRTTKLLAHLVLCDNEIGARVAGRLTVVLPQCPSIARLNLWGNLAEDEGAGRLAEVLKQCPSSAHLDRSHDETGFGMSAPLS